MKKLGIHSVIRKKKAKYIYSKPDETAENLLQRDFYATAPNQKWATDVTEFFHDSMNSFFAVISMIKVINPRCHSSVSQDMIESLVVFFNQLCKFDIFNFSLRYFVLKPLIVGGTGYFQLLAHPFNTPFFLGV